MLRVTLLVNGGEFRASTLSSVTCFLLREGAEAFRTQGTILETQELPELSTLSLEKRELRSQTK